MRRLLLGLLLLLPAQLQSAAPHDTAATTDLTGTWAQLVVHRSLSAVPIVGDVASETTTRLLVTLSQEGELWCARLVCAHLRACVRV
jgi:hypothetical protein